jgi:hypothetical protein
MDLSFLRPLYEQPYETWASVYLDASHNTEEADREIALRWRAARTGLAGLGADAATLDALDTALANQPPLTGTQGLAVFGAGGRAVLMLATPTPPPTPLFSVDALPHAMPLVMRRGERVSWLRVTVDRTGADLDGATEGGVPRHVEVTGHHAYPIRKVKAGGWSEPRYQRSAEVNWDRNAKEIAQSVADLAAETGAEVIVVGGDAHATALLLEHLPVRWRERVVRSDSGSRAPGADPEPLAEATVIAIAERAEQHTGAALDHYASELGRHAAAGLGVPAIVAALARSQVDTGFHAYDAASTVELWAGPEATDLAMSADQLRFAGIAEPHRVRADAAILRALVGTDAGLVLVGPDETRLEGGWGALFRYVDPATVKA